jgi:uncharacterized damage-inducible protein DinB
MTLGRLAGHLAEIPVWAQMTLDRDVFDMRPNGQSAYTSFQLTDTAAALAFFDEHLAKARALLAATTDEAFMRPWSLADNGTTRMTLPKVVVFRSFVMNHMIHHRAQLGVYLRLNDVPVPGFYGPSADEQ